MKVNHSFAMTPFHNTQTDNRERAINLQTPLAESIGAIRQGSDVASLKIEKYDIKNTDNAINRAQVKNHISDGEQTLEAKINPPGKTRFAATLNGKLLRVTNPNGSRFVMAMPRGDSPIIEGLAARKAGTALS